MTKKLFLWFQFFEIFEQENCIQVFASNSLLSRRSSKGQPWPLSTIVQYYILPYKFIHHFMTPDGRQILSRFRVCSLHIYFRLKFSIIFIFFYFFNHVTSLHFFYSILFSFYKKKKNSNCIEHFHAIRRTVVFALQFFIAIGSDNRPNVISSKQWPRR